MRDKVLAIIEERHDWIWAHEILEQVKATDPMWYRNLQTGDIRRVIRSLEKFGYEIECERIKGRNRYRRLV